ncbi:MAG: exonuclease domain-containing protein [Clostridia bacterium]|nr:exonuclease domain-containing protein [Clostridia bacterium]
MKYVILDLEWDSAYFVPEKRFVNQILQIGAVKLDENLEIADSFEVTVKSAISNGVSKRFSELTGINSSDIKAGTPLLKAVEQYNEWLGDDVVTMTWSNSDLYTVYENEKTLLDGVRFKIEKYLDLQSFIQNEMRRNGEEIKNQISLSDAANRLGIETEGFDMHTAKDDCTVCAFMLKKLYNKKRFEALVKDVSKDKIFERISYKPYFLSDIDDTEIDKKQLDFSCGGCNRKLTRKTKWKFRNNNFFAVFYCENCKKNYMGRISFKKTFDAVTVKKRLSDYKKKHKGLPMGEKHNEMQSLSEKV